ncbi:hypothetical protein TRFO_21354 [Tritrichomonas foetus]|uniref:VPS9 domain-containing protein n=1 Tax=Tritrichomonas foetus TaxID=1144522 RepID=A0A1J4KEL7_9EUKA|nr:hypothetical protein TRFO_21354 [Tritrichomonas foetus]|eukprot:OHT09643.1 hypothetical protein TRFO_21354 [Tritrichomonas foetus]
MSDDSRVMEFSIDIIHDILPYISKYGPHDSKSHLFPTKRAGIHRRNIDRLSSYLSLVNNQINKLEGKIKKLNKKFAGDPQYYLCYDNDKNSLLRKYRFLQQKYNYKKYKSLKVGIDKYIQDKNCINHMLMIFVHNLLPENIAMIINETFFIISKWKSNEKIKRYKNAMKLYFNLFRKLKDPMYITDFDLFLHRLVQKASCAMIPQLYYFPFLKEEIDLSKYVFSKPSNYCISIDAFLENQKSNSFIKFSLSVIPFIFSLCNQFIHQLSNQKLSTILLLMFRLITDRLYEKYTKLVFYDTMDCQILWNYSYINVKEMFLPISMVHHINDSISIREFFQNDKNYLLAAELLNFIPFQINPMDILYYFHSMQVTVNVAANKNRNEALKKMMCFDDMFSLTIGTLWAADIPDFEQTVRISLLLSPKESISAVFEYAMAGMQALEIHCRKHVKSNS